MPWQLAMPEEKEFKKYEKILYEYPEQFPGHPRMAVQDRAAQFAPFAALTGFGAVITESGRFTEEWHEPDDVVRDGLDRTLSEILSEGEGASITIIWFKKDERKNGGEYINSTGTVKKFDSIHKRIVLYNAEGEQISIPADHILSIERAGEGADL